jgi:hypothetical protein
MSVLAIITVALIVINFFWTKIAHDHSVGDVAPAWIDRVTNVRWLIANIFWWLFAAADIGLSIHFYLSGEIFFTIAGAGVLAYAFARRTPKAYHNFSSAVFSKIMFIPVWAMVIIGLTSSALIYFSLFFALWSFTSSVMQGRFIYLARMLSKALAERMANEESQIAV